MNYNSVKELLKNSMKDIDEETVEGLALDILALFDAKLKEDNDTINTLKYSLAEAEKIKNEALNNTVRLENIISDKELKINRLKNYLRKDTIRTKLEMKLSDEIRFRKKMQKSLKIFMEVD